MLIECLTLSTVSQTSDSCQIQPARRRKIRISVVLSVLEEPVVDSGKERGELMQLKPISIMILTKTRIKMKVSSEGAQTLQMIRFEALGCQYFSELAGSFFTFLGANVCLYRTFIIYNVIQIEVFPS